MIAIMVTPANDAAELRRELARWRELYKISPLAIVGHKDLVYALTNAPECKDRRGQTFFDNVAVITLSDLWDLHHEALGETAAGAG